MRNFVVAHEFKTRDAGIANIGVADKTAQHVM